MILETTSSVKTQSALLGGAMGGRQVAVYGAGLLRGGASGGTPHCVHMVGADVVKRRTVPSQLQTSRTTAWRMVEDDSRNLFIHLNYDFFTLQYTTYPLSQRTYAP